jgi:hypothetical protein
MPVYCYKRTDNGEVVEVPMSLKELYTRQSVDGRIQLEDGVEGVRDYNAEHTLPSGPGKEIWSDSLGVHPLQVDKAERESTEMGVPVKFDRNTGQAHFENRRHRNQYIRKLNERGWKIGDRDGGYMDPTD